MQRKGIKACAVLSWVEELAKIRQLEILAL